jgi:hypothetical protein
MEETKKMASCSDFEWLSHGFDREHIILNEQAIRKCFSRLAPNANLYLVGGNLYVHPEFGNILSPDDEPSVALTLSAFRFSSESELVQRMKDVKNIYLKAVYGGEGYAANTSPVRYVEMVMACYSPGKKKNATFTIDDAVLSSFSQLCDKMAINKSKFLENYMKEFVQKNS